MNMEETVATLRPFMIRAGVPLVEDLHQLSVDQLVVTLQEMISDPMQLDGKSDKELEELLEQLRCDLCELEDMEPIDPKEYDEWDEKLGELMGKINVVEERLENNRRNQ